LMAFFGKFSKHKQKKLDLYDNIILWNSLVHYESNLILIQWLNEEDWIKSLYIRYMINTFSIAIGCEATFVPLLPILQGDSD
jgi:hypothetical protein